MKGKGAERGGGRGRVVELNVSTSEYSMRNLGTFPYSANYHIGIACLPDKVHFRYFDKAEKWNLRLSHSHTHNSPTFALDHWAT